jgi:Uma2 family endonuclease
MKTSVDRSALTLYDTTSAPMILSLKGVNFSDEQFFRLCQGNQNWQIERTAKGELIIMAPVGGISGNREADLITDLTLWNRRTQLGKVFSSSTIFRLPRGGDRSPDAAWVAKEVWESLNLEAQEKFPPLCPNFVIELRSRTDSLGQLQEKMQEYLYSGLQLGWLINPQAQQVEIYRPDRTLEIINLPARLSGENVLPEFTLDLPIF